MKSWILKMGSFLASFAFVIAAFNINTCCSLLAYQPELPEDIDDLCKF